METSGRIHTLEDKDKKRALARTVPSVWAQNWVGTWVSLGGGRLGIGID